VFGKHLILLAYTVFVRGCAVCRKPLSLLDIASARCVPHTPYALRGAMLARTAGAIEIL